MKTIKLSDTQLEIILKLLQDNKDSNYRDIGGLIISIKQQVESQEQDDE
jgi:hypothetical protein